MGLFLVIFGPLGGLIATIILAFRGARLVWRAIKDDISRDVFGEPRISREGYFFGGAVLMALPIGYFVFLIHQGAQTF